MNAKQRRCARRKLDREHEKWNKLERSYISTNEAMVVMRRYLAERYPVRKRES